MASKTAKTPKTENAKASAPAKADTNAPETVRTAWEAKRMAASLLRSALAAKMRALLKSANKLPTVKGNDALCAAAKTECPKLLGQWQIANGTVRKYAGLLAASQAQTRINAAMRLNTAVKDVKEIEAANMDIE